jgi:hypothetical protein
MISRRVCFVPEEDRDDTCVSWQSAVRDLRPQLLPGPQVRVVECLAGTRWLKGPYGVIELIEPEPVRGAAVRMAHHSCQDDCGQLMTVGIVGHSPTDRFIGDSDAQRVGDWLTPPSDRVLETRLGGEHLLSG